MWQKISLMLKPAGTAVNLRSLVNDADLSGDRGFGSQAHTARTLPAWPRSSHPLLAESQCVETGGPIR